VTIWAVILCGGLITFLTRLSFIAVEGRFTVPAWFRAMLPFVPVATLTAIVAPALLRAGGSWQVSVSNPRLVAGALAIAVAAVWRNVFLTLAVGFGAFIALSLAG
jgi:branched-subunit amino acid transport protein